MSKRSRVFDSYYSRMKKALIACCHRRRVNFFVIENYYMPNHSKNYVCMGYRIDGIEGSFMHRHDHVLKFNSDKRVMEEAFKIVSDAIFYKRNYLNNG